MNVKIKICGLTSIDDVEACVSSKVDYVGFVFHEGSKRNLTFYEATKIASHIPKNIRKVALLVDPSDSDLKKLLLEFKPDILQLHGSETPTQVSLIRKKYGLPIIKSVSMSNEKDLKKIEEYTNVVDQLLIDSSKPDIKCPPGGNGVSFDWELISGYKWKIPWLLAGGLNFRNVRQALTVSGASQLDVSSGVESQPGIKDRNLIRNFAYAARSENHNG